MHAGTRPVVVTPGNFSVFRHPRVRHGADGGRTAHAGRVRGKPGGCIPLAALAAATFLAPAPLQAQETGTVRGAVTLAENGGPVDGALILLIGTGAFTFTDDGAFEFTNVPAGTYDVLAQREQLTAEYRTVTLGAGETAAVDFELGLSPIREEVTVTASAAVGAEATLRTFNAVSTVDSFEIAREAPSTIAEAIEHEPGIANRSFGPGASRPVIRGFGGDRVLIIEDGIPTGDLSATSVHHGMTVDPNSAERIEIVRGPATLLYGSSVEGGLINIITPHAAYRNLLTPPESYGESLIDGTRAQLGADTGSANRQAGTHANLQHAQGNLLYWASGAKRRTGDYDTPEGPVFNTAAELANARTGLGYFGDRAFASLSLTFEDSRFGLPFEDIFHSHGHEDDGHGHDHGHDEETEAGGGNDAALDLTSRRRVGRARALHRPVRRRGRHCSGCAGRGRPRQHMAHMLSFTGYNLTNALFRNHMSFIKDLAAEMGRGVKVGYSLRFF